MDRYKHIYLCINRQVSRAPHQSRIVEDRLSRGQNKEDIALAVKTLTLSVYNEYFKVVAIKINII